MNKRTLTLSALLVLLDIQLGVPLSMICKREITLRKGRLYRFQTAPVDPYDAFRGRYVALGIGQRSVKTDDPDNIGSGQRVYVTLSEDTNGFARLSRATHRRPRDEDYLRMRVSYISGNDVHFVLPFDRYYMNEKDAPRAESLYREHSRREEQDAFIAVRVLNGFPVIEDLYVNDKPIMEFLEEKNQE